QLWEQIGRERYGVQDERHLRFRYGVQVNSLGLTESQPENNVQRIVLEALAVTMGRNARARAIQLPAWNEALGLPRPWDQQWSLRIQQVLAYETDILEYPDIFEGSKVMEGLVAELLEGARAEMAVVAEHGGAVRAGVTTGEWSQTLRDAFGEFRAPTGVGEAAAAATADDELAAVREEVERVSEQLGRTLKILVGKPGLDGHSNGAEQIAVRARDAG